MASPHTREEKSTLSYPRPFPNPFGLSVAPKVRSRSQSLRLRRFAATLRANGGKAPSSRSSSSAIHRRPSPLPLSRGERGSRANTRLRIEIRLVPLPHFAIDLPAVRDV